MHFIAFGSSLAVCSTDFSFVSSLHLCSYPQCQLPLQGQRRVSSTDSAVDSETVSQQPGPPASAQLPQLLLSAASTWFLSKSFRQEFSDAAVKNDHHFPSPFPLLRLVKEQRKTPSFPRTSPEVSFTEIVGLGGLVSRKTSPRFLLGLAW